MGDKISNQVRICNSAERSKIHQVAVWVNNFTNHIVHRAENISTELGIEFDLFKPLLKETIAKLDSTTAYEAQTGPARRKNITIIKEQLNKLDGIDAELYKIISQSILNSYYSDEEL